MVNKSRRVLVAITASTALFGAGLTGTAVANELDLSVPVSSAGPYVDPEVQLAEVRWAQSHSEGRWAGSADPGQKLLEQESRLDLHPKFTDKELADRVADDQARRTNAPAPDSDAGEVMATEIVAEGIRVDIYTPAPGMSPDYLADILRKQGKKGIEVVRHNQSAAQPMAPGDCAYGHARSFTCPVAFWTNNGFEDPLVRFNDHTPAQWPVTNAVYKWNQTPNIDSAYRFNSCPFLAGARCVDVVNANYGPIWTGHWSGFFPTSTMSGPYREHGQVIQLNDYYTPSGWTRNNTVTHEMGHALGLGHNTFSNDVMYFQANMREDIGGENPALLASIYSIYR